jgi:hypothetical protein
MVPIINTHTLPSDPHAGTLITPNKNIGGKMAQALIAQDDACRKLSGQQACLAEALPGGGSPSLLTSLADSGKKAVSTVTGNSAAGSSSPVLAAGLAALAALVASAL